MKGKINITENRVPGETRRHVIWHCYAGYFLSGCLGQIFGTILPFLMEEASLIYTLAGGLLSFMAIGNFFASFCFPVLNRRFSHRRIIDSITFLVPLVLLLFTRLLPLPFMYLLIFYMGLNKGTITIVNNLMVNVATGNSVKEMNYLHMTFAVGALTSPLLMSALLRAGCGWRMILYLMAVVSLGLFAAYRTMDYSCVETQGQNSPKSQNPESKEAKSDEARTKKAKDASFVPDAEFVLIAMIVFCYLGMENTVNGWFVTYLKDVGIMSAPAAAAMVSVTWIMILAGRLTAGKVSARFRSCDLILFLLIVSFAASAVLVRSRTQITAVISIAVLGFMMSAIYPTAMAAAGPLMRGSAAAMSLYTGISAVGGILIPQLIGMIADRAGIGSAMFCMVFDILLATVLAFIWKMKFGSKLPNRSK